MHQCHIARLVNQSNLDSWLQTQIRLGQQKLQLHKLGPPTLATPLVPTLTDTETILKHFSVPPGLTARTFIRFVASQVSVFQKLYNVTSQVSETAAILATHHQLRDFTTLTTPRDLYKPRCSSSCNIMNCLLTN
jgi:hypothetical protein